MEANQWRPFPWWYQYQHYVNCFYMTTYRWWRNPRELWDGNGKWASSRITSNLQTCLPNPLLAVWKCIKLFFLIPKDVHFRLKSENLVYKECVIFENNLINSGMFLLNCFYRRTLFKKFWRTDRASKGKNMSICSNKPIHLPKCKSGLQLELF